MPVIVWLSKLVTTPFVADLLIPSLARAFKEFFETHAYRAELRSSDIQAKAAYKIAENERRAEALREASRRLSDSTDRH